MAVKASASITVAHERDIQSITRFYKIAPSTSTPTAPTEVQGKAYINSGTVPSGWSKAEPAYDGTSTNSLYTCDLTGFTDGNVSWSVVSKSSSYEAAKQAYNEAQNAKAYADDLADNLEAATLSRTQRIYYRSDSSTLPDPPTANNKGKWFEPTQSDTGYNTWSKDIVPLIGGFPYVFMCDQTQTAAQYVAGDECTNSSVMRDNSTMVIDGGSITTGVVSANYIEAAGLQIGAGQVDGLGDFMSLMTFKNGVLRIAKPGSRFAVELSDEGLFFKQNNTAVSYINMNRLYIPYAVVLDQMMIGKEENNSLWAWTSEEDGSLTLKWIGGNN